MLTVFVFSFGIFRALAGQFFPTLAPCLLGCSRLSELNYVARDFLLLSPKKQAESAPSENAKRDFAPNLIENGRKSPRKLYKKCANARCAPLSTEFID